MPHSTQRTELQEWPGISILCVLAARLLRRRLDAYREIADMNAFDLGVEVIPRFVGLMRAWVPNCYHRDIGTMESLQKTELDAPHYFSSSQL